MLRPTTTWLAAFVFVSALIAPAATAFGAGNSTTNQGSTPKGRPFQYIQGEFQQVNAQLEALQTQFDALQAQVTTIQNGLQAQINGLYASVASLQSRIASLEDANTTLQARVAANEAAIAAIKTAISALQAQLVAAQEQIAANTAQMASLQQQINANSDNIQALQAQLANLQAATQALRDQAASIQNLIDAHTSEIAALERDSEQVNTFLANLVNGNCQVGQAIGDIGSGGIIQCTQAAAGGRLDSLSVSAYLTLYPDAQNLWRGSCPAGYTLTGGGYSLPPLHEYLPYLTDVTVGYYYSWYRLGWDWWDMVTIPTLSKASNYRYVNPATVVSSYPAAGTYTVQVQYTPRQFGQQYFSAFAACIRLQ